MGDNAGTGAATGPREGACAGDATGPREGACTGGTAITGAIAGALVDGAAVGGTGRAGVGTTGGTADGNVGGFDGAAAGARDACWSDDGIAMPRRNHRSWNIVAKGTVTAYVGKSGSKS